MRSHAFQMLLWSKHRILVSNFKVDYFDSDHCVVRWTKFKSAAVVSSGLGKGKMETLESITFTNYLLFALKRPFDHLLWIWIVSHFWIPFIIDNHFADKTFQFGYLAHDSPSRSPFVCIKSTKGASVFRIASYDHFK